MRWWCGSVPAMVDVRTRDPWVIALASQKGGVGKTTLALELASVFADTSGRALVVDIDPQRTAEEIIVATENVGHLARYCDARLWTSIV